MQSFKQLAYLFTVALALLPSKAFAHGEAEEVQSGLSMSTYGLLIMGLLFVLFVGLYIGFKKKGQSLNSKNAGKKGNQSEQQRVGRNLRILKWGWMLSLVGVIITGSLSIMGNKMAVGKETYLEHIHGLGYSTDGKQLIIPAHDGLKIYSGGHWGSAEGEKHDYMGFSAVDDGFYSSGHPAPGSDKKNPFGIVKSIDEGKTFKTLDLYEEIDFHMMGVGYQSHAIYVMNPQPNSRMDSTGLYYSTDETKTWIKSEMKGINEDPSVLAVHPSNKAVVAVGTQEGVYVSNDYGQNFEKVLSKGQATSLYFNVNGMLHVGGYDRQAYLLKLNVESKQTNEIALPNLDADDAIAYIAENPVEANELAVATFKKDVYVSEDGGNEWEKVADQGEGMSEKSH